MKECWLVSWKNEQGIWGEVIEETFDLACHRLGRAGVHSTEIHLIKGYEIDEEFFEYTEV